MDAMLYLPNEVLLLIASYASYDCLLCLSCVSWRCAEICEREFKTLLHHDSKVTNIWTIDLILDVLGELKWKERYWACMVVAKHLPAGLAVVMMNAFAGALGYASLKVDITKKSGVRDHDDDDDEIKRKGRHRDANLPLLQWCARLAVPRGLLEPFC
eukprot:TRINITY_DN32288_c0_g1_i1.p1 TRINITY_DN32288_c0_g1~~TRINITY_DN32288_c0_g1_i1.p1  ORF type:complete len:157 (+),score=22.50 TRINITY_DN32288_c0_g1_i1:2-472(+)